MTESHACFSSSLSLQIAFRVSQRPHAGSPMPAHTHTYIKVSYFFYLYSLAKQLFKLALQIWLQAQGAAKMRVLCGKPYAR